LKIAIQILKELKTGNLNQFCSRGLYKYQVEFSEIIKAINKLIRTSKMSCLKSQILSPVIYKQPNVKIMNSVHKSNRLTFDNKNSYRSPSKYQRFIK